MSRYLVAFVAAAAAAYSDACGAIGGRPYASAAPCCAYGKASGYIGCCGIAPGHAAFGNGCAS